MGIYQIDCICGKPFLWHSSDWAQCCSECRKTFSFDCMHCGKNSNKPSIFWGCCTNEDCEAKAKNEETHLMKQNRASPVIDPIALDNNRFN